MNPSAALQRVGQLPIAVLIGITLGNQIKAARFRRAVDLKRWNAPHESASAATSGTTWTSTCAERIARTLPC